MNGQEHTSALYTDILQRLHAVRTKEHQTSLIYGTLATLVVTFLVLLVAVVSEELFSFGTLARTILFGSVATGVAIVTGWFVVRPLLRWLTVLRSEHDHDTARKVGEHFPMIRDRLLDAMEMYEEKDRLQEHYSVPLIDASFSDLYQNIQQLKFSDVVSNQHVLKMRKIVLYTTVIVVLTFVVSPAGFLGSMYRIMNFNQSFASPLAIRLYVEPGNVDAVRGQTVPVTIRTEGKPVQTLSLHTRREGRVEFDTQTLKPGSEGVFRGEISNIKTSTEYFASAEEIKSDQFKINVLDRPLIKSSQLTVTSPAYTKIPAKQLEENAGDISAYPGSKISLRLTSSKELSSAVCVFRDSSKLPLTISGAGADGSFFIKKNSLYRILLKDHAGLSNLDPIEYSIKLLTDEFPTAEILDPAKNVDLTEAMKLDLFIRVKDDFGFSKLRLAYRLAQSKYEKPAEVFSYLDIPMTDVRQGLGEFWYHWNLTSMNLVPEDALAYYVEVFDNDNINGPKSGKSETYMVRVPSIDELFSDVSQTQTQSMESMQSVAKETQQLKKEVENFQREMKKANQKMDWQQQKKAEEMLQRYEAMKKNLEQTSDKMEEMMKKMEDNKLLSDKTMEKYQELQKLLDELKNPDLEKALKKLQESMKQLSPEQMKQAMEQLKNSEEQFRKNLERMVELLKRIHIEQKLDELIKRTEEMKKQQESLRQQTSKNNPDQQKHEELSQKQDDLQKQMEALQKETSGLKKKMEEFSKEMPMEEMSKAEQQMQQNQTEQKMSKSSRQMRAGKMQDAQQQQEQSEKDLDEDRQELEMVQKKLQQDQMKQIVNEMKKQLQNVIELSKREEALKEESKSLDANSQRFRENGEKQNDAKSDLNNVANAMSELGKKTFAVSPEMGKEIGNALNQMEDALAQTEGRNPGGTSQKQGDAMGSLNRAAMMMQGALNGLTGNGGSGGMGMAGLMGRLGQMSGQQSGINKGTQGAMGQGQGLTPEQQSAYQRLAGQQSGLQKSLEDLSREAKNTGDFSKLLGNLDEVAKQMQEVQTDLVQNNVNPETIQKQDRILSRLLDASRSTRERDYEKRRTAESGKNIQRTSPAGFDLTTQEGKNRLRQEMLKVMEGKYSKDYQELIRKYFEQLEKEEVKQ